MPNLEAKPADSGTDTRRTNVDDTGPDSPFYDGLLPDYGAGTTDGSIFRLFPRGDADTAANGIAFGTRGGTERSPLIAFFGQRSPSGTPQAQGGGPVNVAAANWTEGTANDYEYTGPGSSVAAGGLPDDHPLIVGLGNPSSVGEHPEFDAGGPTNGGTSGGPTSVGEHPEEEVEQGFVITPDANIFPVGGNQYNIGYDTDWDNFGPSSLDNTDFSFGATDANHLNGHLGIDVFGPTGAPILSPVSGEVVLSGQTGGGANRVWIRQLQPDGDYTYFYFTHLDTLANVPNGPIQPGTQIGTLGNTGAEYSAPHLHYSIFENVPPGLTVGQVYNAAYAVDPYGSFQDATDTNGNAVIDP